MSGVELTVDQPVGRDELFILETSLPPPAVVVELLRRVGRVGAADPPDWEELAAIDLSAAALEIRGSWLGDPVLVATRCALPGCRIRVEMSFSITEYVARRLPDAPDFDALLRGGCPGCGQPVSIPFEPAPFAVGELRAACSDIYLEIHAIASTYGWSEESILDLPRSRRRHLVSIITGERSVA